MTGKLKKLLEEAKDITLSDSDAEIRRRSFAYGNAHLENSRVTRRTINLAAEKLVRENNKKNEQPA